MNPAADHAVQPRCPRCSRPVRGSLEVAAAFADIGGFLADLRELEASNDPYKIDFAIGVRYQIKRYLDHLNSELSGAHLDCLHPMDLKLASLRELVESA